MGFHVGQKVVCVDDVGVFTPSSRPVRGRVYTITRMLIDDDGDLIFHLAEITRSPGARRRWGKDVGYWSRRFRPAIERSTETGMSILRKIADDASKKRELTICGND